MSTPLKIKTTKLFILFLCVSLLGFSPNPKYITESDEYHIVKKGDTLYSIAKKYETTVDALKRINNLPSDKILIGQKNLSPEQRASPAVLCDKTGYSF